ncbi:hypothetical protein Ciccas_005626 [Cichlidogyrus casuarinus]|uniref:Exoribonuclease Xrn1 D2/D3 domain-containing protein n=1 Tax=Cichlidogyrus casuarinus TaxID=1844966 RepID=A0ABD2Q835_9PLAT
MSRRKASKLQRQAEKKMDAEQNLVKPEVKTINIGFDLRSKQKHYVLEWSRFDSVAECWRFSDRFVHKLLEYRRKFPGVIACMSRGDTQVLDDYLLFPRNTKLVVYPNLDRCDINLVVLAIGLRSRS